jgi:uncharacterized RDD family membrane protein YckC
MDRTVGVRTPESIAFSYELAGLGSRFLAVCVDLMLQLILFTGLLLAATRLGGAAGIPFLAISAFLTFFGYFIAFEALWNGQTPGKKFLGIRVVRDGGYPLDLGASAIRNLIRVGEMAFGFYALSAISALASSENKRLGDIAAGTIVVRDVRADAPASILAAIEARDRIVLITDEERALIDRFVARRNALSRGARLALAGQLAQRVRPRVSADLQRLDDEALLDRLTTSSS